MPRHSNQIAKIVIVAIPIGRLRWIFSPHFILRSSRWCWEMDHVWDRHELCCWPCQVDQGRVWWLLCYLCCWWVFCCCCLVGCFPLFRNGGWGTGIEQLWHKMWLWIILYKSQLYPDASLVKASAPESRSATQVAPLEISDSWAVRPRTCCCCCHQ